MYNINILSPKTSEILYTVINNNGVFYLNSPKNKFSLYNINDLVNILNANISEGYILNKNDNKLFKIIDNVNLYLLSPLSNNFIFKLNINDLISIRKTNVFNKHNDIVYKIYTFYNDVHICSPINNKLLYIIKNGMYLISFGNENDLPNLNELQRRCQY